MKKMDIRETKQIVLTNTYYYVLGHNYSCNQSYCKINGVEFISPAIYIYTEVKNINNVLKITMNLNIEDCNGVTIAKFRNIEVEQLNTYDFDEELSNNLLLIVGEIKKNENYYNKKYRKSLVIKKK